MDYEDQRDGFGELVPVISQPEPDASYSDALASGGADDQIGFIGNFIRSQPVLTLSIAFGLGLLVTSFLARQRT